MDFKTETQLKQEISALWHLVDLYKQDAKRYQWIKQQSEGRPFYFHAIGHKYPENLDEAIDNSIKNYDNTRT